MTNVLIVEDHVSMRESLTTALTAAGDFSVVGEVPNADYALDFCKHLHPELVLMDVCTEGGASGLKAVEAIRKTDPEVKIIVMTAFDETGVVGHMIMRFTDPEKRILHYGFIAIDREKRGRGISVDVRRVRTERAVEVHPDQCRRFLVVAREHNMIVGHARLVKARAQATVLRGLSAAVDALQYDQFTLRHGVSSPAACGRWPQTGISAISSCGRCASAL